MESPLHSIRICNGKDGLFFLNKVYGSKQAFKEDAFFLIKKEWRLIIGQEVLKEFSLREAFGSF